MRELFLSLEIEAKRKGLTGRFEVFLSVEAKQMPAEEVVARLISQRLAAHPERHTEYPWGSVAFVSLPRRLDIPPTRLYSPHMLRAVFDWNTDLPDWDGVVCRVNGGGGFDIDHVTHPIGLIWRNTTRKAVQRRAWSPIDLFGDATNQITPGEFGIIYLAYNEGTRAAVADERLERFFNRITEWEHPGSIRLPISLLVRLYLGRWIMAFRTSSRARFVYAAACMATHVFSRTFLSRYLLCDGSRQRYQPTPADAALPPSNLSDAS